MSVLLLFALKEKTTRIRWLQMLEVKNPYFEDVIRDSEWQSVLVMFSEAVTPLLSDLKVSLQSIWHQI